MKIKIEDQNRSYRKPYHEVMATHWWLKLRYYLFYIVRESTALFMLWVSIVLMYGVICAHTNDLGQDEFYRFIFFLQHPVVVIINVLALFAALLHTVTWFNLAPKAVNMVIASKKPPVILFIGGLWSLTVLTSVLLLLLVFGYFK